MGRLSKAVAGLCFTDSDYLRPCPDTPLTTWLIHVLSRKTTEVEIISADSFMHLNHFDYRSFSLAIDSINPLILGNHGAGFEQRDRLSSATCSRMSG
jgi:hypothetical protein